MDDTPGDSVDVSEDRSPRGGGRLRAVGEALGLALLGPVLSVVLLAVAGVLLGSLGLGLGLVAGILLTLVLGQYVPFGGLSLAYLKRRLGTWGRVRSYLGVRVPSLRELGVVVLGYLAIFAIVVAVAIVIQLVGAQPGENQTGRLALEQPWIIPLLIVAMFLVVAPMEELLYRGVVQGRLREALSPAPAILIASAVFAVIHWMALTGGASARLTTVAILFFPSIVFGAVYEYTDNLVVPVLLHAINNTVLLALIWVVATSGEEVSASALPHLLGVL